MIDGDWSFVATKEPQHPAEMIAESFVLLWKVAVESKT